MSKDIPDRVEIEETSEDNSKRKRTSEAWHHFKRVKVKGIQFAECNYCKARLKAPAGYGTTHLHKHYEKVCKKRPRKIDIRQSFIKTNQKVSDEQELGTHIFNQEEARRELASMVILHDYPLSVVDHIDFRRYSTCLQPCFNMISRNTLNGDILKIYKDERTKYYNLLGKFKCRIAITTDMWTSSNNKGFMAVTGHFIDDNWTLQNCILRCCTLNESSSSIGSLENTMSSDVHSNVNVDDSLDEFEQFVVSKTFGATNLSATSEFYMYLEESLLPRARDFDILNWWKTNGVKFPTLQKMARDILAIPVSTVVSESAFSSSGKLINPHRNRLHHTTVEALMCSRRWLWNEVNDTCWTSDGIQTCPSILYEEDDQDDRDSKNGKKSAKKSYNCHVGPGSGRVGMGRVGEAGRGGTGFFTWRGGAGQGRVMGLAETQWGASRIWADPYQTRPIAITKNEAK
ncbi:UNVERIFIED_CONTAM: putative AC transposase [Sesamum radiatum]|uniref:AC transposase n=2 Tax=Sesamum TaxID=4181 RepID=A0AAW2V3D5_SESRA